MMESICTAKEFTGHRDPYTGALLTVRLYIYPFGPRYRVEGGYDTATRYGSMERAASAWSMKDGVLGVRSPADGGFVCAYTGRRLTPRHEGDAYWFEGGFSMTRFYTRDELLAAFAALEGRPAPEPSEARVEAPVDAPPPPEFYGHEPSDDAFEHAEEVVDSAKRLLGAAPASPVSMSVRQKPRSRARRSAT